MDFYNFEKYNDVFSFGKFNQDYQPLLRIYKDNYQTSLNTFLKEYDENTELRFLESQLYLCDKEIIIQKSIITSLESRCQETFNYVKNRIDQRLLVYMKIQRCSFENKTQIIETTPENPNNDDHKKLKAPTVIHFTNNDDDVLNTYATTENFIKFISNRITSLCLINEFLEQRKQELETELKVSTTTKTDYISLIATSYFDAQDNLGNNPELLNLVKDLFQQTILRFQKIQERKNCMTSYEFRSRVYFALESIKNRNSCNDFITDNNNGLIYLNASDKDITASVTKIEFRNIADWIDEICDKEQPLQPQPLDLSDTSAVEKTIVVKEPYGEMFSNNGFELFEHILTEYVKPKDKKGRKSDLIYYYWEMHNSNPQYIHQKPTPFFKWFDKKYTDTTGQLKTYDNVKTDQRKKDYSTALDWFKSIK